LSERGKACSEGAKMSTRGRRLDEIRHAMQETHFRREAERRGRPYLTPEERADLQRKVQYRQHWRESERRMRWLYPMDSFESYIPKDYQLEGVEPPAPSRPSKPARKNAAQSSKAATSTKQPKKRYIGMPAKFHGRCIICGEPIEPGDDIRWAKGHGAWHVACDKPVPLPQFGDDTSIADYFPEAHQVEWDHKKARPIDVPIPIL